MSKNALPDAWNDDDWERQADKMAAKPPSPKPEVKLSKAERRAKHQEFNRQLWEDADAIRERPLFLQTHEEPVYKSEFKPQMKVLARKPPPKIASRADASGAMSGLKLQDDEDSDEEDRKKAAREFEERKARAIREREEKQRKYQEAREKIFGSGNDDTKRPPSSGDASRNSSRGKGRGGKVEKESRGTGSNDQSPARLNHKKQLFDANEVQKESSPFAQRRANTESGRATPTEKKPIRAPRGPDGSAGFASKGFRSGDGV